MRHLAVFRAGGMCRNFDQLKIDTHSTCSTSSSCHSRPSRFDVARVNQTRLDLVLHTRCAQLVLLKIHNLYKLLIKFYQVQKFHIYEPELLYGHRAGLRRRTIYFLFGTQILVDWFSGTMTLSDLYSGNTRELTLL